MIFYVIHGEREKMSNVKFDEMYKSMNTKELTALAKELGVPRYYTLNKKELV